MAINSVTSDQWWSVCRAAPDHLVLQFFNRNCVIGIDAHLAGDLHGFFGDLARSELRVCSSDLCRGLRVGASAADGSHTAVGLDHVALSAEQKRLFFVAN